MLSEHYEMKSQGKGLDQIILNPVGNIKSKIKKPFLMATDNGLEMQERIENVRSRVQKMRKEISQIVINEDLFDALDGIEKYSHIVVLYWAHKISIKSRSLTKIHPMGRKELPLAGIFSTCSPIRPNPMLMTIVRLVSRKKNVLEVAGLDAVDGSPVLDIKPYVKNFYPQENLIISEWMQQIIKEVGI
ncbi:tRNA (adenine37-N6)-methyltransferase [Candidatus Magnetomoraceae bacterium gMMP-15]